MNCVSHTTVPSEAVCSQCGHTLCHECIRRVHTSVYCEDCLAASLKSSGSSTQNIGGDSPETAFVLGLIPGVGAIYNGEYFKAAIHVLIFGMLTSLGVLLAITFYFYMPFEAYYTAKKRKLGTRGIYIQTPIDRFYEELNEHARGIEDKEFWGGIALIVIGGLYLLNSFDVISFHGAVRFWPLAIIAAGFLLLLRSRETQPK